MFQVAYGLIWPCACLPIRLYLPCMFYFLNSEQTSNVRRHIEMFDWNLNSFCIIGAKRKDRCLLILLWWCKAFDCAFPGTNCHWGWGRLLLLPEQKRLWQCRKWPVAQRFWFTSMLCSNTKPPVTSGWVSSFSLLVLLVSLTLCVAASLPVHKNVNRRHKAKRDWKNRHGVKFCNFLAACFSSWFLKPFLSSARILTRKWLSNLHETVLLQSS